MPKRPAWWCWLVLAALTVSAVAWRVTEPYRESIVSSDEVGYLALAANLAAGRGFTEFRQDHQPPYESRRTAWRAPLFPALLAAAFAATENDETAKAVGRVGQAVLGGLAVFFLGLLGWRVWPGPWAGLLAAALLARDAASLDLAKLLVTEPLFVALMLAALVALAWARDGKVPVAHAVAGALVGLALLARPVWYVFAAAVVLALVSRATTRPGRRRLAAFGLALALVVAPWVVRNTLVNGALTGITSNAGFNLYLDNSGRSHLDVWTELHGATESLPSVDEAEQNAAYRSRALAQIAAYPSRFAANVARRLRKMAFEPFTLTLLAIIGLAAALWRRLGANALVALGALGLVVVYAVVLYDERMAVTLLPYRCLYAAVAIVWAAEQARRAAGWWLARRAATRA